MSAEKPFVLLERFGFGPRKVVSEHETDAIALAAMAYRFGVHHGNEVKNFGLFVVRDNNEFARLEVQRWP